MEFVFYDSFRLLYYILYINQPEFADFVAANLYMLKKMLRFFRFNPMIK